MTRKNAIEFLNAQQVEGLVGNDDTGLAAVLAKEANLTLLLANPNATVYTQIVLLFGERELDLQRLSTRKYGIALGTIRIFETGDYVELCVCPRKAFLESPGVIQTLHSAADHLTVITGRASDRTPRSGARLYI